mmetsp:Transcript_4608/g.18755  ORF Transcript_4608/g.18755 Transcript_4608/m.18755 type:complete len:120 (-) Transcript_4608:1726-2085(-)
MSSTDRGHHTTERRQADEADDEALGSIPLDEYDAGDDDDVGAELIASSSSFAVASSSSGAFQGTTPTRVRTDTGVDEDDDDDDDELDGDEDAVDEALVAHVDAARSAARGRGGPPAVVA